MKAYGIFAGGGVKGAALAGCLAAAQDQEIQFVGYGGTSAGSMVALLAAAGYTGKEIGRLLTDLDFRTLLDDGGNALQQTRTRVSALIKAFGGKNWLWKVYSLYNNSGVLYSLSSGLGLYPGETLKKYLFARIKEKRPTLANHAEITFEHLEAAGGLPLKIVASDIIKRRPAIFSRTQTEYGPSVVDAVRASTSYPFAFRPVEKNGYWLVDGGLASNLPVFLFDQEYRETRIPAIAFDLTSAPVPAPTPAEYGVFRYGGDLLNTSLEASDDLLRQVLRGVHYVPIETPAGIDTLDFGLPESSRKRLFETGYNATSSFLSEFPLLQRVKEAGHEMKRLLQAEYGPPQLYAPVLYGLAKHIEKETDARNVRAHVMLPTGRPNPTRIVVYGYGMESAADADLELPEHAGCSGRAWTNRAPTIANLEEAASNPEHWGMSADQHAKVPDGRKAMLAVPIHGEVPSGGKPPPPIGTLAVDTVSALDKTGWLPHAGEKFKADSKVVGIMMSWAYVLYHLLRR